MWAGGRQSALSSEAGSGGLGPGRGRRWGLHSGWATCGRSKDREWQPRVFGATGGRMLVQRGGHAELWLPRRVACRKTLPRAGLQGSRWAML